MKTFTSDEPCAEHHEKELVSLSAINGCIFTTTRSFTLLELLIAIGLTGLILTYLYESMHGVDNANKFYEKKLDIQAKKNKLQLLIYNDLLQHNNSAKIEGKSNGNAFKISFKTKHSTKFFFNPQVTYIFYKKEKALFRLESTKALSFRMQEEQIFKVDYNKFENIEDFEIQSKKQNNEESFLVYYVLEGKKSFFQVQKI